MFPLHCNQCYHRRKYDSALELFVSRCGHIFCKECVRENCCLCKRPFKPIAINKDMPQSMAEYFTSPLKLCQRVKKVMHFQYEQEHRWVEYICRKNEEEETEVANEMQAYGKLDESLICKIKSEREKIRKLRDYIDYHDRRLEQARYMVPPITLQPRPRHPSRAHSVEQLLLRRANANMMNRFSQPLRPNIIYPHSPTISANSSSITAESTTAPKPIVTKKQRAPPQLLPLSDHQLLNLQFSSNSSE